MLAIEEESNSKFKGYAGKGFVTIIETSSGKMYEKMELKYSIVQNAVLVHG